MKIQKKIILGGVHGPGGGGGVGGVGEGWVRGAQGGCDRRIEIFGKIHLKKKFLFLGRGGGGGLDWCGGSQGGCE